MPSPDPKRSALMARVRQCGTSAELIVGRLLRSLPVAYRLNVRGLPGRPDFANRSRKWAVFVNGCFWHRHTNCSKSSVPSSNAAFWTGKFADNRRRDARAVRDLRSMGYRVVIVWECQIRDIDRMRSRLSGVLKAARVEAGQAVDHRGVVVDVAGRRRR